MGSSLGLKIKSIEKNETIKSITFMANKYNIVPYVYFITKINNFVEEFRKNQIVKNFTVYNVITQKEYTISIEYMQSDAFLKGIEYERKEFPQLNQFLLISNVAKNSMSDKCGIIKDEMILLGNKSNYFTAINDVVMDVQYTNSWFNITAENEAAVALIDRGCVIIGQHADSTGAPAAIQKAYNQNKNLVCYSVGYNVDMLDVAPDVVLTSPTNNWEVYYETIFRDMIEGKTLPTDWSEGYAQNAVGITALGKACAAGTAEKVDETIKAIKDGTLKVFDCSKFTVKGEHLTSYTTAYGFEGNECIKTENGVTYFDETSLRSAPYFDIRIDGITEIEYQEEE